MFGRKVFGKKSAGFAEPSRPAAPPEGQIFSHELFVGEMGDFLRQHGYAPDDPRNQATNVQPLSVLLAEDQAGLRRATEAVNGVADYPIVPVHLLPPRLWDGNLGPWLRQHLDLSPYRPWNTIFLPGDDRGAATLGLPVAPPADCDADKVDTALALLSCIHDDFAGKPAPDVEAMLIVLRSVRKETPAALPPDVADFSDKVREARANVRAAAFLYAITADKVAKDTILKSHATFLGAPGQQLTN